MKAKENGDSALADTLEETADRQNAHAAKVDWAKLGELLRRAKDAARAGALTEAFHEALRLESRTAIPADRPELALAFGQQLAALAGKS